MMAEGDPKAWLVDLDGTLYRAGWLKLAMCAELLFWGPRSISVVRTFRREHERLRKELVDPVDSPYEEQLQRAARRLDLDPLVVQSTIECWMIRRPRKWVRLFRRRRLLADIAAFRQQGGRTALVSDYPAGQKLIALGAAALFETVVANGETDGPRRLKPWPDGYLLAAERLGIPPGQCLVLGDRESVDGEAARRAGMLFRKIG